MDSMNDFITSRSGEDEDDDDDDNDDVRWRWRLPFKVSDKYLWLYFDFYNSYNYLNYQMVNQHDLNLHCRR